MNLRHACLPVRVPRKIVTNSDYKSHSINLDLSMVYGMPILEVEQAKTVIVVKRSMKPGYAGIENDLFFQPKTSMLFGDAKKVLQDLVAEIKNL